LNGRLLGVALCALAAGCAGGAGTPPGAGGGLPGDVDTLPGAGEAAYPADSSAAFNEARAADGEWLFYETHAYLAAELRARERPDTVDVTLAEVRSIIETAEELHLEGRTLIAIGLLAEAAALLRTNP